MTLSVNVMTRGPAGRVGALLRLLRPVVDELVVAVDDRAEPSVLGAVSASADRVVRYPYAEPVDRPLAWLHSACSGDWVLTVDDDEIPSSSLLGALTELSRTKDVTHFWLPRRWLFPDRRRYLDEAPWRPDYQLRLVLNDPRLLSFPDETHKPVAALGPGRHLDLPLYHADALLSSTERRREKALSYERARPGKRVAGRPMNELYYLPELVSAPRTAGVPEADLTLIESVLEAADDAPELDPEAVEHATRAEIDRLWAGRALADSAYRARLTLVGEPGPMTAGEVRAFDVLVENLGEERWPWGRRVRPEIRLAHRWRDAGGRLILADGLRTALPADLGPGESAIVPADVGAPGEAGRHVLELDLVHEHVAWFGSAVTHEVEIRPRRRVGVLAATPAAALPLVAWLAQDAGELEPAVLGGDLAYLEERLPAGRAGGALLALRTLALAAGARARALPLPPPARSFLQRLDGLEALVVGPAAPSAQAAALLAARALGVPALLADRAPGHARLVDRLLLAAAGRAGASSLVALRAASPRDAQDEAERHLPEWEYVPEGWRRAAGGWDADSVARAYRKKWPLFLRAIRASGPLGVYHEVPEGGDVSAEDPAAHNLVLTFGYVLGLAARGEQRLSVLDWGGGCGHYYVLARALRPDLRLDYHVQEVPKLAALGRELLPEVTFHDGDGALARPYDLVLASGSLQYAEDWTALLARLGAAADRLLYVTRLPVAFRSQSFVVLQRAGAYGYDTEYLGWVVNRSELLGRAAAAGLTLERELLVEGSFSAAGAPEDPVRHRGFLWRPAAARTRTSSARRGGAGRSS